MMRPFRVATVAVGACLASCSDDAVRATDKSLVGGGAEVLPSGTDAESSEQGTSKASRDICDTLDYGHDRSNEEYYVQFATDALAADYSKGFLAANEVTDAARPATDARTVRLVQRVYAGFQRVFPRETAGMNQPPRVFTVDNRTVNAFAGYDDRREYQKAPWIFWVHQGTIDSNKPDAQLEALFAHELGHLVTRNMLPKTRAKIRTHYRVPGGREHGILGAASVDDPVVRGRASELREIGALVGREPVFGSMPISAYEDSDYQSMLKTLARHRTAGSASAACQTADRGLEKARSLYKSHVSTDDLTLVLTPAEADQITKLSDATGDALRQCYPVLKMSLLELKIEDRGVQVLVNGKAAPLERLLDPTTPEHEAVYAALMTNQIERDVDSRTDLTTVERLLQVASNLHARAAQLVADDAAPIDELRVYDLEEDADDAAIRVLHALGDDARGVADLFTSQLDDPASCTREIASGQVPRYGRFIDPHNATCWRAFHASELSRAIAQCTKAPASGTGSASRAASIAKQVPFAPVVLERSRRRLR